MEDGYHLPLVSTQKCMPIPTPTFMYVRTNINNKTHRHIPMWGERGRDIGREEGEREDGIFCDKLEEQQWLLHSSEVKPLKGEEHYLKRKLFIQKCYQTHVALMSTRTC